MLYYRGVATSTTIQVRVDDEMKAADTLYASMGVRHVHRDTDVNGTRIGFSAATGAGLTARLLCGGVALATVVGIFLSLVLPTTIDE